ncbi:cell division protein ZipA [Methylomarinovum tepidoasis]|uniref:Cell division protein ZipA n=1 Tax=Methylomarinovum tepidoasis TaxID=2840183 RepID=A0AAU9BXL0_9GAMM|nr:cell division protein ZipA [Methylomarinovum sp. IN45]BCX88430.1 cell division protein ZipA [Methylomarinovum sp. IN45]
MESLDKTTLRIVLAVAGVLLLVGVFLWDYWKKRRRQLKDTFETLDRALPENDFELDEIDAVSLNPAEENLTPDVDVADAEQAKAETAAEPTDETPPAKLPEVIQLSIAAPKNQPFRGPELLQALTDLGLEYGEMEIFHYRRGGETLFSLASLVKPGTFPIERMEEFHTPGVTLFMQPPLLKRPLESFEIMVKTCHALAQRLGGSEWDDRRQPLTAVRLAQWRRQLKGEA